MHSTPTLATRFARNTHVIRSDTPLAEEQMRSAAPSIFATGKHASRSERYTYIPTIEVLRGLRKEGFEPFMVAQSKSRIEGKTEYTKHMIRMRHAGQVERRGRGQRDHPDQQPRRRELVPDAGRRVPLRLLQRPGLSATVSNDIRIPHKGNVQDEVIEGAFRVLDDFEAVDASTDAMKALTLNDDEERAFATAALALRYGERSEGQPPAPITAEQLIEARRPEDFGRQPLDDASSASRRTCMRGGQPGRSTQGRRIRTREVAQHRPRREPEPGALGAGRGDEEAQALIAPRPDFSRNWSPACCRAGSIIGPALSCANRARRLRRLAVPPRGASSG